MGQTGRTAENMEERIVSIRRELARLGMESDLGPVIYDECGRRRLWPGRIDGKHAVWESGPYGKGLTAVTVCGRTVRCRHRNAASLAARIRTAIDASRRRSGKDGR